ncbi:MAG: GNAT family N-acetyltransferase [Dehalococcoidia bacterium]
MTNSLLSRLASRGDLPVLQRLIDRAIEENQRTFLDTEQITSSRAIMGLDTQLIDDGTYFVVECNGAIAGCGGWSRRATMYGGDHSSGRDAALLNPKLDAARVRAMYTHPAFVRRGIGKLILDLCERAARAEGFSRLELVATRSGEPLYRSAGYQPLQEMSDDSGGVAVPLLLMGKSI